MLTPTVLLYNLTGDRGQAIQALCRRQGLLPRQVLPMEQGRSLGALLGLPGAQPPQPGTVPGEMLVMAHLSRPAMEAFLDAFAPAGIPPVALKAVFTPTNAGWTGPQLYRELLREHRQLSP